MMPGPPIYALDDIYFGDPVEESFGTDDIWGAEIDPAVDD